jgi:hypothetical protein
MQRISKRKKPLIVGVLLFMAIHVETVATIGHGTFDKELISGFDVSFALVSRFCVRFVFVFLKLQL